MAIFTAFVVTMHLLASVVVVVLILLHSGRGGGLSDMFGGGMGPGGMGGSTVVERNLDRITVATALVWSTTTLTLSFLIV